MLVLAFGVQIAARGEAIRWISPEGSVLPLKEAWTLQAVSDSGKPVRFELLEGPAVLVGGQLVVTNFGTIVVAADADSDSEGARPGPRNLRVFNRTTLTQSLVSHLTGFGDGSGLSADVLDGSHYLMSSGSRLRIYDVTDEAKPRLVSETTVGFGPATELMVDRDWLYYRAGALVRIGVSDPQNPIIPGWGLWDGAPSGCLSVDGSLVFRTYRNSIEIFDGSAFNLDGPVEGSVRVSLTTRGEPIGIHVRERKGILVTRSSFMQPSVMEVYDFNDPDHPIILSTLVLAGEGKLLKVFGQLAFVGFNDGFELVDLQDPVHPRSLSRVRGWVNSGQPAMYRNHLLVPEFGVGIHDVDIADPSNPVLGRKLAGIFKPESISVSGDLAFVRSTGSHLEIHRLSEKRTQEIALRSPGGRVLPLNKPLNLDAVSRSRGPVTLGIGEGPGRIGDGRLMVTHWNQPVTIVAEQAGDLEFLPARMERTFNLPSLRFESVARYAVGRNVSNMEVAGDRAFLGIQGEGIEILDLANLSAPAFLGLISGPATNAESILLVNGALVVETESGVLVYDVGEPSQPTVRAHLPGLGRNYSSNGGLVSGEGRLVQRTGNVGLRITDVPVSGSPQELWSGHLPGWPLQLSGPWLYMSAEGQIQIYEMVGNRDPIPMAAMRIPGDLAVNRVLVSGGLMFVGGSPAILDVNNVLDPRHSVRLATVTLGDQRAITTIRRRGDLLWLGTSPGSVTVLDISNPARPLEVGRLDTTGAILDLEITDDLVFVTDVRGGLGIFQYRRALEPSLDSVYVPHVMEVGEGFRLNPELPEGVAVRYEVESGPGRIVAKHLIADGPGTIRLRIACEGSDFFFAESRQRVIQVDPFRLSATLEASGGQFELSWTQPGFVLESSPSPVGPWTAVAPQSRPARFPVTDDLRFFRVRAP